MDLIKTCIVVGLFLVMFVRGLRLQPRHAFGLRGELRAGWRAFLAVDVLVPLFAVLVAVLFQPPKPIVVALALMAASPMAPLGLSQVIAGVGRRPIYATYFALLAGAVVTTPVTLSLLASVLHFEASVSPLAIALKVFLTVAMPVALGMLFRRAWPHVAARAAAPLYKGGMLLIALSFVVILAATWRVLGAFHVRGYLAIALFVVFSLTAGHLLGGRDVEVRSLLAIQSATRNPGFALLIAHTSFPNANVAAVLVPYFVTFLLVTGAYRSWNHPKQAKHADQHGGPADRIAR